MPSKKIKYNFFQIVPKKNVCQPVDIQAKLRTALDSTDFPASKYFSKHVYLTDVTKEAGHYIGTIVLVQTENIPGKVNVANREITRVDLTDNEGLENHATFLIDPEANILAIESSFPNPGIVLFYLTDKFSLPKSEVSIIINPVEFEKFHRMNRITKLSAKIAKIQSSEITTETANTTINGIIKTADTTDSDEISFIMTSMRGNKTSRPSLNISVVGNMVSDLLSFKDTEEVTELKVIGEFYEQDGTIQKTPLDFIKGRLNDFIEIDLEGRHSSVFSTSIKHALLRDMYGIHRTGLIRTYKID